jgi:hypothetical protein
MTPAGFALALTLGICFGGFIGVAWDRWQRRYDDHRPSYQRKAVSKERLARMHILNEDNTQRWDERND